MEPASLFVVVSLVCAFVFGMGVANKHSLEDRLQQDCEQKKEVTVDGKAYHCELK